MCMDTCYGVYDYTVIQYTHYTQLFCFAASVESLQCIQILQTCGTNFGVKSVHGATPMHKAAASGYVSPSVRPCMFDMWILVCDRAIPGQS